MNIQHLSFGLQDEGSLAALMLATAAAERKAAALRDGKPASMRAAIGYKSATAKATAQGDQSRRRILAALSRPKTAPEICVEVGLTITTVTSWLRKAEQDGHVTRTRAAPNAAWIWSQVKPS